MLIVFFWKQFQPLLMSHLPPSMSLYNPNPIQKGFVPLRYHGQTNIRLAKQAGPSALSPPIFRSDIPNEKPQGNLPPRGFRMFNKMKSLPCYFTMFLLPHRGHQHRPVPASIVGLHQRHLVTRPGDPPADLRADEVHLGGPGHVRDGFQVSAAIRGLLDLRGQRPAGIGREEVQRLTRVAGGSPGAASILGGIDVIRIGDLCAGVILAQCTLRCPRSLPKKNGSYEPQATVALLLKIPG